MNALFLVALLAIYQMSPDSLLECGGAWIASCFVRYLLSG